MGHPELLILFLALTQRVAMVYVFQRQGLDHFINTNSYHSVGGDKVM